MGNGGPRWPGWIAVALALLTLTCAAGAVYLEQSAAQAGRAVPRTSDSDVVVSVLFTLVGAVILLRDGRNRCGWVMSSCALVGVSALAHQWAYDAEVTRPGVLPCGELATWLSAWTYWPYWLQPTLLPVLFPHGRVPPGRWQRYVRAVLVVVTLGVLASAFKPDPDVEGLGLMNPLGLGPPSDILWVFIGLQAGGVALLALIGTPIALTGLWRRQRAASEVERAQLQWLLLGFATCFGLGIASAVTDVGPLFTIGFASIPVCVAVAVLRHGMLDVELVAGRTVAYGLLTGVGLLTYVGLVALAGRYLSGDGAGPVVAAVVVALAASARTRVQRLVDRRLFGARRDPYSVVQQVGESSSVAGAAGLVDAVRSALRLPFVQLLDSAGEVVAASGEPVAGTHVLPVVDRGRRLGVLVVGRRTRNEKLRAEEESALRDVARRAGAMLLTSELQVDLQRSIERTVTAREEERRRLRRDLHDGVGPALAGMALQLDSLAGRLQEEPALAKRAEGLRDRLRSTVGEVRRIVDGLRPGVVDELGLVQALRQLASDDTAVEVVVQADLPEALPAAIEVAAYRIASEAVANALRHGHPTRVTVEACLRDADLHLQVGDDGTGFGADATAGIGLASLHDRAVEVGGQLTVDSRPGAGTRVVARLPLAIA